MPVYNGRAFLGEALESIRQQTFVDWELVAVDDGSQDGSGSVLESFAATDRRIRILTNETNSGICAALNRGWREARGAYIARLDADDVALPDRLARQVEALDAHPSVAVVGSAAVLVDGNGRRISVARVPTSSRAIHATLGHRNCVNHPSVTLRRSALEAVGGYRFDHVEDYDLWLRLSERFDLLNLAEPLILYRLHAQQVSRRMLEEQVRRTLTVRAAARQRRAGRPDPLAEVAELTPDLAERMGISASEIAEAVNAELLFMAWRLEDVGRAEEARELITASSETLASLPRRELEARTSLRRAEWCWMSGRRIRACRHVAQAVRLAPIDSVRRLLRRFLSRRSHVPV